MLCFKTNLKWKHETSPPRALLPQNQNMATDFLLSHSLSSHASLSRSDFLSCSCSVATLVNVEAEVCLHPDLLVVKGLWLALVHLTKEKTRSPNLPHHCPTVNIRYAPWNHSLFCCPSVAFEHNCLICISIYALEQPNHVWPSLILSVLITCLIFVWSTWECRKRKEIVISNSLYLT